MAIPAGIVATGIPVVAVGVGRASLPQRTALCVWRARTARAAVEAVIDTIPVAVVATRHHLATLAHTARWRWGRWAPAFLRHARLARAAVGAVVHAVLIGVVTTGVLSLGAHARVARRRRRRRAPAGFRHARRARAGVEAVVDPVVVCILTAAAVDGRAEAPLLAGRAAGGRAATLVEPPLDRRKARGQQLEPPRKIIVIARESGDVALDHAEPGAHLLTSA